MDTNAQHYSYDQVPYPDLSYVQTHPDRLATLGTLLGMKPVPIDHCHVLEIGTASGANLLAMAMVLPLSTFVGMDISEVQIKKALDAVEAIGLTNISFHQMDILDITPEFGQFDYIIIHGIFSWVPPLVQEKLLDICQHNLTPQGIAYISYNTYPGWHTMDIIRNMMIYRTRDAVTPAEKSAQAREWIIFMGDALKDKPDSAYAAVFQNYLNFRKNQTEEFDHAVLLHDELEALNQPFYFYQFIEQAEQHSLQYLVESDFPTVMPNGLSSEVLNYLGQIAHSTVELEQYFDFLRNQSFRRTLLCHADINVDRRLSIQPVREFYVSSTAHTLKVSPERAEMGIETFEGIDGSLFSTNHPLTKAAFHYLLDSKPERIHFDVLLQQAASSLNMTQVTSDDTAALAGNLLQAFAYSLNLIEFHTFAPPMTTVVSERPLATAYSRYQARQQPNNTTLIHTRVQLDNFSRLILSQLDGENDFAMLLNFLVELVETKIVALPNVEQMSPEELRKMVTTQLELTLEGFAKSGLLVS
ncbi:MAG: class I SAM-dependent methyltransferase [Chloroflexota bacterium]